MKKRIIVLLVTACLMGVQITAMAVDLEPPMFTVTLVPHEKDTNLLTDVTDAEAGEEVQMDVMLKNNSDEAVTISAFALELDLPEPDKLAYTSFTKNREIVKGSLSSGTNAAGNRVFDFYSNGKTIDLDSQVEVRLITLTLTVADSGVTYEEILTAGMTRTINFHLAGTEGVEHAIIVPGQVEIVTTFDITWTGLVGPDETTSVGIGLMPTHDIPVKAGYTFTGWNPALTAASADKTYTAQWTPTSYSVDFAPGTAFADGVTVPTSYDIETPITVTPVRTGHIFTGWTAEPKTPGDTDYNWPEGLMPIGDGFTDGYYGNVKLTPVWTVDADVVFADYAYAGETNGHSNKLLLAGVSAMEDGGALFYNAESMFTTEDVYYLALLNANGGTYEKAYVTIVPGETTAADVIAALSVDPGTNAAIRRDGNVNGDELIDSGDFGIVDDLLLNRQSNVNTQMRLEADVVTSEYDEWKFGSIDDIVKIILIKNNG